MSVTLNHRTGKSLDLNIPAWRIELDAMRDELNMQTPQWGPIGQEVYERTYSRRDDYGKAETWIETAYRTVLGNLSLVDPKFIEPHEGAQLLNHLFNFRLLPAGRHIWSSGVPGRQFLFNCHRAGFTERFSRHFEFVFNELMKAGGVGTNYSNRYIDRYAPLKNKVRVRCYIPPEYEDDDIKVLVSRRLVEVDTDGKPVYPPPQYIDGFQRVVDSREGWYGALDRMLEAYYAGQDLFLHYDLGLLRPKGSPIKGFGGISSGPWALAKLLKTVSEYLNTRIGHKLNSLDFMMVDHLISECVVAGNVRRSARMSIKHWQDVDIVEFINCKTLSASHWSTNISVEVDNRFWHEAQQFPDSHAANVLEAVIAGMYRNGEPGFVNTELASVGERGDVASTNPCGEIFLEEFENCNLGHVNLGAFWNDEDGAYEAFRLMQRYLIRATFGDITDSAQREVVDRNRRTGVGIFGYQAWCVKQGVKYSESWQDRKITDALAMFKGICDLTAATYARELNIPIPIKKTTLAPTGTIAKLSGTTEGAQNIFARYFNRRVRYGAGDPKVARLFADGYAVEDDLYTPDTKIVTFPVKDVLVAEVEALGLSESLVEDASEIKLKDFLAIQAMLQSVYVDNSISLTINFDPETTNERDILVAMLFYGPQVKGTTLMPEMTRPQMPYERITKEEWEATGVGKIGQGEMECATGACPVK